MAMVILGIFVPPCTLPSTTNRRGRQIFQPTANARPLPPPRTFEQVLITPIFAYGTFNAFQSLPPETYSHQTPRMLLLSCFVFLNLCSRVMPTTTFDDSYLSYPISDTFNSSRCRFISFLDF
jgi:hypothetical protein